MAEHFSWFQLIDGFNGPLHGVEDWHHVTSATVVGVAVLGVTFALGSKFRKEAALIPSPKVTFTNAFELFAAMFVGLMKSIIGKDYKHFAPLLLTLATFILFNNILGMIPGFLPGTDNLNTTAACAIIVFLYTHWTGVKHHGFGYLKQFTGPIWWMAPLMFPIELVSHFARPFSLSIRLLVNIFADHVLLAAFLSLVPLVVPLPFILLGLFVAVIQTVVFTTLSMVYFSMALEGGH